MGGFTFADSAVALPGWAVWAAALSIAAAFAVICTRVGLGGLLFLVILLGIGPWLLWDWREHERHTELRAVEASISALDTSSLASGASLACLEGWQAEALDSSCEHALFASPEKVSAVLSLVAARIDLLDMADRLGQLDDVRSPRSASALRRRLRQVIERDRFGFAAHVLASRHDCTADTCAEFRLLGSQARISDNLKNKLFSATLAKYATQWPAAGTASEPAVNVEADAAGGPGEPGVAKVQPSSRLPAPVARPLSPGYFLPSADSIPPVSIMTVEPSQATSPAESARETRSQDATGSSPAPAVPQPRNSPSRKPRGSNATARP